MAVQTRPNWNITEPVKGSVGSYDPGSVESSEIASGAIVFGRFVAKGASAHLVDPPANTDTVLEGVSLISDYAGNYANKAYIAQDVVAVARRGYFWVEIDPADKPAIGTTVLVSTAANKEGMLVGTPAAGVTLVVSEGVRITQVLDSVAEVYIAGDAKIPCAVSA